VLKRLASFDTSNDASCLDRRNPSAARQRVDGARARLPEGAAAPADFADVHPSSGRHRVPSRFMPALQDGPGAGTSRLRLDLSCSLEHHRRPTWRVSPLKPPVDSRDHVADVEVPRAAERRTSRARDMRRRHAHGHAPRTSATRESQSATWWSVLHGARQLAPPRRCLPSRACVPVVSLRRLLPAADARPIEQGSCPCGYQADLPPSRSA